MRVRFDATIDINVLPDEAKCKCTVKSPLDMDECPMRKYDDWGCECWPDECDEYTEDEEDENGKHNEDRLV